MNLILNSMKTSLSFFGNPISLLILVVMGVVFYKKNLAIEKEQRYIVGEKVNSAIELTFSQLTMGLIGGIFGSFLLSLLGIAFNENSAIEVLFMISFLLMFYRDRMVCFAYSGAILGILSLFTKYVAIKTNSPNSLEVSIITLISFVAIMHLIEGFLVIMDGFRGALPQFTVKNGEIVAGFKLKRQWILPMALLMIGNNYSNGFTLPKISVVLGIVGIIGVIASPLSLYAMLGYKGFTQSLSKEEKARESGAIIIIYAIILLAIGQIGRINLFCEIISIVLMPIGHELMINYQSLREKKGDKIYISDHGMAVLDVLKGSKFKEIGLKSGDKILTVNGINIEDEKDILRIKNDYYGSIDFKIKKRNGLIEEHKLNLKVVEKLNLILVPKNVKKLKTLEEESFREILEGFKREIDYKLKTGTKSMEIREKEIEENGEKK